MPIFELRSRINLFISLQYILYSIILFSLDNEVLETSKRRAMFYNILSQTFIVKCFTKSLVIRIHQTEADIVRDCKLMR